MVTTARFLPQHQEQRSHVLQMISAAEARGQTLLVEMNRQVLTNLDRIVTGLREDDVEPEQVSDAG